MFCFKFTSCANFKKANIIFIFQILLSISRLMLPISFNVATTQNTWHWEKNILVLWEMRGKKLFGCGQISPKFKYKRHFGLSVVFEKNDRK